MFANFSKFTLLCYGYSVRLFESLWNYEHNFSCIGLWNVFYLSQNWIYPQSLSSDRWSSPVLLTHVNMLNIISVLHIHTRKHKNHVPFLSFPMCSKCSTPPLISYALEVYLSLSASLSHIDVMLMLSNTSYWFFVDVSNCFVGMSNYFTDSLFNSFGM